MTAAALLDQVMRTAGTTATAKPGFVVEAILHILQKRELLEVE